MNELTQTITNLNSKIEKLITAHKELKKENEQLVSANKELKNTTEEQKTKIEQLEINNSKTEQKIITETKSKINELVQEIDECLAILK
jgi:predicted nuclease with TOPRIM domain